MMDAYVEGCYSMNMLVQTTDEWHWGFDMIQPTQIGFQKDIEVAISDITGSVIR